MFKHIKSCLKNAFHALLNVKANRIDKLSKKHFAINIEQCAFHYSSGMVIQFNENGHNYFFRLCRKMPKDKSLNSFMIETIRIFLHFNELKDSTYILELSKQDLKNKKNISRLKKISSFYANHFDEMCAGLIPDFSLIGLPSLNKLCFEGEHVHFLQFLRGSLETFQRNRLTSNNLFLNESANRTMATKLFADLLSLNDIIPNVIIGQITIKNESFYGTIMDEAKGRIPAFLAIDERLPYDGNFVKCISNLEYFDYLCYQTDRRIDNYAVERKNDGIIHLLSAYDNDQIKTFFSSPFFPNKMSVASFPILNHKGEINRKYMSIVFYNNLLRLKYADLRNTLSNFLSFFQIIMLYKRITKMKKAVLKTVKHNSSFLVEDKVFFDDYKILPVTPGTYLYVYLNDTDLLERIKRVGG